MQYLEIKLGQISTISIFLPSPFEHSSLASFIIQATADRDKKLSDEKFQNYWNSHSLLPSKFGDEKKVQMKESQIDKVLIHILTLCSHFL